MKRMMNFKELDLATERALTIIENLDSGLTPDSRFVINYMSEGLYSLRIFDARALASASSKKYASRKDDFLNLVDLVRNIKRYVNRY